MNERERGDELVVVNLLMFVKWYLLRWEFLEYDVFFS